MDDHYIQTLQWILDTDPMHLCPTAENILQRYFLVLFYFATANYDPEKGGQRKLFNPPTMDAKDLKYYNPLCYHEYGLSLLQDGLLTGWFSEESSINFFDENGPYEEVVTVPW